MRTHDRVPRRLRTLHVTTGLASGGAENQLLLFAQHTRHDIDVACLYDFGRVGEELRAGGVVVRDLRLPSRYDPRAAYRLARVMRRGRYDVVHVHLYRASLYGRIAARLAGVPVVVTSEHSLGEQEIEGAALSTLVRALYLATERLSDMTIAVSPLVQQRLVALGVPRDRTIMIPNGLHFDGFAFDSRMRAEVRRGYGIEPGALVIGSVGRLAPVKRQHLLIEATAPMLREGAWLLLVGDGRLRADLERLALSLGVAQRTIFTGDRHDIPRLLAAMDVFASPGAEETFGLAPLEAVANGLPVVVSRCPALEGLGPPNVHWTSSDTRAVGAALRVAAQRRREREPVPERLRRQYDIAATAAAIDDLYVTLARRASYEGRMSARPPADAGQCGASPPWPARVP